MEKSKSKKLQLQLWIPECKNIQEGQQSWEIMCIFIKALIGYMPPTHKGNKVAEAMWDDFVDALLKKYDSDFSCGEPIHFHQKTSHRKEQR